MSQEENAVSPASVDGVVIQPKPKKTITKRVREYDVIVSDRVYLVDAANEFVSHIVNKQVLPSIGSGVIHSEIPLSDDEVKTFKAALQFLQRQFENGYSSTEPYEKRVETEETQEF